MFGCLFRLVVLTVVLGAAAWFTRDWWEPRVFGARGSVAAATTGDSAWTAVGDVATSRGEKLASSLTRKGGPAYVALTGEEAAGLALGELRKHLPSGMRDVAVRIVGDRVEVRAVVRPAEFGGKEALGPMYSLLPDRDTLRIGGTFDGVRPGLGEFRVDALRIHDFPLPAKAIAPLLRQLAPRGSRPDGLADDAIPVPLPATVGDVRVKGGKVVLYRATP